MLNLLRKNGIVIGLVLLGMVVSNVITYTYAHGGNLNLIHGCIKPITGFLRIVGANDICNNNETGLDWNIQGVQGPPGPAGNSSLVCADCTVRDILFRMNSITFQNANLDAANLRGAALDGQDLTGASFVHTILYGMNAPDANFTGANLTQADMRGVSLNNANFTNANLNGVDFTYATLTGANFTNADLSNIIWKQTWCPDETNSDDNGGTCIGHL